MITMLFAVLATATPYFEIQAVDEQTGRGVPLVEIETINHLHFVTDNAGRVAFLEPGLMDREVFFYVRSHGYEFPKDGFGFAGNRFTPKAGGRAELKLKRLNIAERLYRVTGEGLFHDTILLGKLAPVVEPLLNALVLGQDSVQAVPYRGKIFWFWGDTNSARYPLGQFRTSGATSSLPGGDGVVARALGIDLTYFAGDDGFSRPMIELAAKEGPVWIDGVGTVPDEAGHARLVCHYSRRESLAVELEQGVAVFNDERNIFESKKSLPLDEKWRFPHGHVTRVKDEGTEFLYIGDPFLMTRVKATLGDVLDPTHYEAWNGQRWTRESGPPKVDTFTDVESGRPVTTHAGSVVWNAHRGRWIMIANQASGGPSLIGEMWYAEALTPTGPWRKARKILTHDRYSFYNPTQHDFLDEDGGRYIYFEGTYSESFSGNPVATPRYDYNQIMYRLDLDDPRLAGVR